MATGVQNGAHGTGDALAQVLATIQASERRVIGEIGTLRDTVTGLGQRQDRMNETLTNHSTQIGDLQRQMREVREAQAGGASSGCGASSAAGSLRTGANPFPGTYRQSPYQIPAAQRVKLFVSGWPSDTSKDRIETDLRRIRDAIGNMVTVGEGKIANLYSPVAFGNYGFLEFVSPTPMWAFMKRKPG